jgi:hypothetical protein
MVLRRDPEEQKEHDEDVVFARMDEVFSKSHLRGWNIEQGHNLGIYSCV